MSTLHRQQLSARGYEPPPAAQEHRQPNGPERKQSHNLEKQDYNF